MPLRGCGWPDWQLDQTELRGSKFAESSVVAIGTPLKTLLDAPHGDEVAKTLGVSSSPAYALERPPRHTHIIAPLATLASSSCCKEKIDV